MKWLPLWLLLACRLMAADAPRPNIVIILADDLGWGDAGCYAADSKIPTPNLDKLAASGMRFTNAYCPVSVCSPSRYALMTGSYPWRSWKKRGVLGNWDRPMIEKDQLSLPGMLKKAGYATGGFGKWHLGAEYPTTDGKPPVGRGDFKGKGTNIDLKRPIMEGPMDRGFDEWRGMICSSELLMVDGRQPSARIHHELYKPLEMPGYTDLPALNLEDLLPRASGQAIDFIGRRAGGKEPFFLYFAPYVPHIPLAVGEGFRGKTKAGDYGDYVHQLDHHIGLLLAALEKSGQRENTLVIFASDNGSQFETTGEGHRPNAHLRGGKWMIHEGGVRTPFIASWPGRIPAGTVSDALLALNDMPATLAPLAGADLPPGAAPDSLDLSPLLLGKPPAEPIRREVMMRASAPDGALRQGDWKYVKRGGKKAREELYDLAADPSEKKDLAASEPARLKEMAARFKSLMEQSQQDAE
ncbi:arylsulfatase [Luteolibacter sp. SL250]|uniref:sulfatase family protein n=1 Tax=Luteolibacter sp. SL250 TaxID=2995170 RepID=UPI0022709722|nr:arylsulfatase [Luteolibacter sp. SL250]WAC20250.1 arylsulfatase [Luteolibacter sp. SL250]